MTTERKRSGARAYPEPLARVNTLVAERQVRALERLATEARVSVAEALRQTIDLGLAARDG